MILTCPKCETQYFAEDSTIANSGRSIKCTACGHSWFFQPSEVPLVQDGHEIYRNRLRARRKQGKRAITIIWGTVAASLVLCLVGLIVLRAAVVEYWPRTASVYAALGMEVNRFGLAFEETEAERFFDGTTPVLEIRGALRNISSRPVSAPWVQVALLDDTGKAIADADARVIPALIPPDARAVFSTRIANPPFQSFELELSLVPSDKLQETEKNDP